MNDERPLLCHLNLARSFRGGERQTELLIRELAACGARQRLIAREGTPLPERVRGLTGLEVAAVGGRRAALGATRGAALLHAHETKAAQVARLRHALSGTPYIITRRVDNVPHGDPFTRSMYLRAAEVAVLSRAIAAALARYDSRIRIRTIPSAYSNLAVDEERVRRIRNDHGGKFIAGTIGALDDSHKGQLTLIAAAARLADSYPQVHFILVGGGPDERLLRETAAGAANVAFTGWVENVGDYLAAFDLFVFPSMREGLGSILTDAMQFGLPVVASESGGIPDLIRDGDNGLLVPPGDAEALAGAVARLYDSPALRDAMARANRRRAEEYRPSLMAARYRQLYQEILPRAPIVTGSCSS